jgi:hypothetical protein
MRPAFLFVVVGILLGCDSAEPTFLVEYVAAGRSTAVDVAFIAPLGLPLAGDTTFVRGDTTFVSRDTTYVLNVRPPWQFTFEGGEGERLFLRVKNRTNSATVSAIIFVNEDFFCSDGSGSPAAAVECGGEL